MIEKRLTQEKCCLTNKILTYYLKNGTWRGEKVNKCYKWNVQNTNVTSLTILVDTNDTGIDHFADEQVAFGTLVMDMKDRG